MASQFLQKVDGKVLAATPFGWIEVVPQFEMGDEILDGLYKSVDGNLTIVTHEGGGMSILDNPAVLRATF